MLLFLSKCFNKMAKQYFTDMLEYNKPIIAEYTTKQLNINSIQNEMYLQKREYNIMSYPSRKILRIL